jgi:branched-chain amino acid transport system permease protein
MNVSIRNKVTLSRIANIIFLLILVSFPTSNQNYLMSLLYRYFTIIALAVTNDMILGHMGELNLSQTTFFGISSYIFVIFWREKWSLPFLTPFVSGFIVGPIVSMIFALVMALILFKRLSGAYLSIATLGVGSLVSQLIINFFEFTGGSRGIPLPPCSWFSSSIAYYFALGFAILSVILYILVTKSPIGYAMRSIRDDIDLAEASGIDTYLVKVKAMLLSVLLPSIMGPVYALYLSYINPATFFGAYITLLPSLALMIGGRGQIMGAILGVLIIETADRGIMLVTPFLHLATVGVIVVLVGVFAPGGIIYTTIYQKIVDLASKLEEKVKKSDA